MAYYVGDIPAEDLVIEPLRAGQAIDLTLFDEAEATLRDFDGVPVAAEFYAHIDDSELIVEWPDTTPFLEAGLFTLNVTLLNAAGRRERVAPVYLVAQAEDGWHTIDSARDNWSGAPDNDNSLYVLLQLAKAEVLAFGTTHEDPAARAIAYRTAQLMQARNTLNAGTADPATGGTGEEGFVLVAHPLDWAIKQRLRPETGVPEIG